MENNEEKQKPVSNQDAVDFRALIEAFHADPEGMATQALAAIKDNPLGMLEAAAALLEQVQAMTGQVQALTEENRALHIKVITDDLTGAYEKNYLMEYLARNFSSVSHERRQHQGKDVLLMIDLDGFKPINDTLGHDAGDEALKRVVDMLQQNTRATDIVARAGGDEFIVLLRGIEEDDAIKKANDIGDKFKTMSFQWKGYTVPIRASIGILEYDPTVAPHINLALADDVMFDAKRAKGETRHQKLDLDGGPS